MNSRGNCLIFEDDRDVRELLALILTGEGFDVYTVATAAEGLRAAQTMDLALIALDLGPPKVDGNELVNRFKHASHAPLLMITTKARATNEAKALGADAYLVKPFSPALLRKLVNQLSPRKPLEALSTRPPQEAHTL
jgi:DNA-binding response OmpR family regulator